MPEINYKIKAKIGDNELEVIAVNKPHAEELFEKYKKEILRLK